VSQVRILASTVSFRPTMVQLANLELIKIKRITVCCCTYTKLRSLPMRMEINLYRFLLRGSVAYLQSERISWLPEPVFLNVYGAQESIQGINPPAYVDWRAGTITLFLLGD
jgi:hypothetical protein